jgi:riboflavin kinase/FMN adenylyltransferase
VTLLSAFCEEHGIALKITDAVSYKGERVSSTRIRDVIEKGNIEEVTAMLGRPFSLEFEVVHGNHLGRTIGIPTINQSLPDGFILPRFGVYASAVHVDGKVYCGVTNIGVKPTVGSERALSETWLPDFSGDLYGKTLRLELLGFIRDERKFPSLEALRGVIEDNAVTAREIFAWYTKENEAI